VTIGGASVWARVGEALSDWTGPFLSIFDRFRTPPERSVAFAIATIALGAKVAKADGRVTRDEVAAFREVFSIPEGEERNAARVYDLARQDMAGFETYARRIRAMFADDSDVLPDLLEGLFHVAVADGDYHACENHFLARVAQIFELPEREFLRIRAEFVPDAERDPYEVLGVASDASLDEVRAAWRTLVRDTHPDRLVARGLPQEAIRMAEKRLITVNRAWEAIRGRAEPALA
jgi:DnaJ like chaperone protein